MWYYNYPLSIKYYSKEYVGTAIVNVKTKHCGIRNKYVQKTDINKKIYLIKKNISATKINKIQFNIVLLWYH